MALNTLLMPPSPMSCTSLKRPASTASTPTGAERVGGGPLPSCSSSVLSGGGSTGCAGVFSLGVLM
jgi:hypothetical protein